MAVLIDMDMPSNCEECPVKAFDPGEDDYVCPFSGVATLNIGRQDSCPMREVSKTTCQMTDEELEAAGLEM